MVKVNDEGSDRAGDRYVCTVSALWSVRLHHTSTIPSPVVLSILWLMSALVHLKRYPNKAGYTAQDAPSMRSFHLRK